MQIVTDSGTDVLLTPDECQALNVHIVPLVVTMGGQSYREGVDITRDAFYRQLEVATELPLTSQPSVGALETLYRELAQDDPDIISVHMSSGLSGTVRTAQAAATLVPEANVTVIDTLTLSIGAGWQVEAAARAAAAGWPLERIVALCKKIRSATNSQFTLRELRYLIHGGRISHIKGLLAQLLNIKPIIGVEQVGGTYEQRGQARSFSGALNKFVELMERVHGVGARLRVSVAHSSDPEGGEMLREAIARRFRCEFTPPTQLSLVLGAHTGPTMVAAASAPASVWDEVPGGR
ncbi:MAG: DegV family protein [Anaerolineae bacterium]|jgi:DegV family protein with EDD domain|nr:DegV family protein [Chloroflexota bacterium]